MLLVEIMLVRFSYFNRALATMESFASQIGHIKKEIERLEQEQKDRQSKVSRCGVLKFLEALTHEQNKVSSHGKIRPR